MNNILKMIGESCEEFVVANHTIPNAVFLGKAEHALFNTQCNAMWQITLPCDGVAEYHGMKLVAVDLPSFLAVGVLGKIQQSPLL